MPSLCSMLGAAQVVALAERPVGIDEEFRRQKQRQAARAGRRVGQPRQHEMDDVVRHVVVAVGDEDLLAEQAIAPVAVALRPGPDRIEVGARLRLGEVHRPGPSAADHRGEIAVEQLARAGRLERVDRALGQERTEREGHRRAVPDLGAGDVDEVGQAHAAELDRRGDAVPARLRPPPVDVGEARRRRHHPILVARAGKIAGAVERRDLLGGEAPGFGDDRRYGVPIEIAGQPLLDQARQVGDGFQRKQDIADRRTIRHVSLLHAAGLPAIGPAICRRGRKSAYVQSGWRATRETRRAVAACLILRDASLRLAPQDEGGGAPQAKSADETEAQIDPPRGGEPGLDRRRGRVPARGRPRRRADRDGLRPCRRRNLGCGRRGDLRRQGPAGDQPAHRPCSRPRGGARTCRLRPGGRTAGARLLARTAHARPARVAGLPGQPARARRSRHCGAARAGA